MPTLTITLAPAIAQEVAAAYGIKLELGRNATEDEVRQVLVRELKQTVRAYRWRQARAALADPGEVDIP